MATKVINLQDLDVEPAIVLVVNDVRHEMKPATVKTFINQIRRVEKLGTNASQADELEVMIEIIIDAFPTLTADEVREWPISHINNINEMIRDNSATEATEDEEKAKEAEETGNG